MTTVRILFAQEARRVSGLVTTARQRITRAMTVRDVVRLMSVPVRAQFRSLKHLIPDLRSLSAFAERRADEIVQAQLKQIATLEGVEARRRQRGLMAAGDWRMLPGNFPRLARFVQVQAQRLIDDAESAQENDHGNRS